MEGGPSCCSLSITNVGFGRGQRVYINSKGFEISHVRTGTGDGTGIFVLSRTDGETLGEPNIAGFHRGRKERDSFYAGAQQATHHPREEISPPLILLRPVRVQAKDEGLTILRDTGGTCR